MSTDRPSPVGGELNDQHEIFDTWKLPPADAERVTAAVNTAVEAAGRSLSFVEVVEAALPVMVTVLSRRVGDGDAREADYRAFCVECGERVEHRFGAWICPTHYDRGHVRFEPIGGVQDTPAREARAEFLRVVAWLEGQSLVPERVCREDVDAYVEDFQTAAAPAPASGEEEAGV